MPTDTCSSRYRDTANVHDCYLAAGHDGQHRASADPDSLVWGSITEPEQAADDAQTARQARRDKIDHLLFRAACGVLKADEGSILRTLVQQQHDDGDQAHAGLADERAARASVQRAAEDQTRRADNAEAALTNVREQRDADAAAYNATVNAAQRESERHRQQLAAALGEPRGRNWDHLIGRAAAIAVHRAEVKQKLADSETVGHRLLQRAEAAEAAAVADERRADHAEDSRERWRAATLEQQERASRAEAALTRVRDALDGVGPLARNHIERALGDDQPAEPHVDWQDIAAQRENKLGRVRAVVAEWRTWSGTSFAIRDIERALSGEPGGEPQEPAALDGDQPVEAAAPRLLSCGWCYEENGEEVHPHPECGINAPAETQPDPEPPTITVNWDAAIAQHLLDLADAVRQHLARALGINPQEPQ